MKIRLDYLLVQKGFFISREKAQYAIKNNFIKVSGKVINKPSTKCENNSIIEILDSIKYISKGGLKLEKALIHFNVSLKDKIVLDIGSSTGGFTDCSLQFGAKKVYAIDIGSNQLAESLKQNSKVFSYENTDIRNLNINMIEVPDVITIDVSFISLKLLIDKIKSLSTPKTEIICLIKPQFECGKESANQFKGIIKSKKLHKKIVGDIIDSFKINNLFCSYITFSPIKGKKGNIEYLALFKEMSGFNKIDLDLIINEAFAKLN